MKPKIVFVKDLPKHRSDLGVELDTAYEFLKFLKTQNWAFQVVGLWYCRVKIRWILLKSRLRK